MLYSHQKFKKTNKQINKMKKEIKISEKFYVTIYVIKVFHSIMENT